MTRAGHRDVCVSAPTGQGKTLCYVVPILNSILTSRLVASLRAVVVAPTRELAQQIFSVFQSFNLDVHCRCYHGEATWVGEIGGLEATPLDVMVATPGRLIEHFCRSECQSEVYNWRTVEFFVLDEVDALFAGDHEFTRVIEGIRAVQVAPNPQLQSTSAYLPLPKFRCTRPRNALRLLLFSATLSRDPSVYKRVGLVNPHFVLAEASGSYATPESLEQYYVLCTCRTKNGDVDEEKLKVLWHIVREEAKTPGAKVAVFCRSKETVGAVAHALNRLIKSNGLPVVCREFSAAFLQQRRMEIIAGFRQGKINVLVASDVAARGLDVVDLGVVVNFTLPASAEMYIHRAGRTARAGKAGKSYSLCSAVEHEQLQRIFDDNPDGLRFESIQALESASFDNCLGGKPVMEIEEIISTFVAKKRDERKKRTKQELDVARSTVTQVIQHNLAKDKRSLKQSRKTAAARTAKVTQAERRIQQLLKTAKNMIVQLDQTQKTVLQQVKEKERAFGRKKEAVLRAHEVEVTALKKRQERQLVDVQKELSGRTETFKRDQFSFLADWVRSVI
ncbi:MAG: uncharacterized protein KVP18_003987 [Porospora cf. gigantea A]|uniref:uncharacterized protein n=1 Tax=Porospora cf. gigantea A TaxID=2853593 RepID=UPI003559D88B|nr:MAG: hypothetical protein KVP18_003987 [Porospora cf. gigantea A]